MKKSYLKLLEGKRIKVISSEIGQHYPVNSKRDAEFEERTKFTVETQLIIGEFSLTISMPFEVKGTDDLKKIEGLRIEQIDEGKNKVSIELENRIRIEINTKKENFLGPEAMCLNGPNNLIVVWD